MGALSDLTVDMELRIVIATFRYSFFDLTTHNTVIDLLLRRVVSQALLALVWLTLL